MLIVVLSAIVFFFTYEVVGFQEQLPELKVRANELFAQLQDWLAVRFKIQAKEQIDYINKAADNVLGSSGDLLGSVTGFFGDFFTVMGIMPVYIFFILYYRNFFEDFICMLFPKQPDGKVHAILDQIEVVSQSYIKGLLTVVVIVGTLNTIGLLLLGIENAIFFGALASMLAIIPYIGIIIGSLLPATIALITKDSAWYSVGVVGVMLFVQLLEGNFITPNIVGGRVSVNPFIAILALFLGGFLWGPAGMILAIPYTAILKVVFDNVEPLRPYGFLIGEPKEKEVHGRGRNPLTRSVERNLQPGKDPKEEKDNEYNLDEPTPTGHGKKKR
jgi:predicted PurR-regulated permease PerM